MTYVTYYSGKSFIRTGVNLLLSAAVLKQIIRLVETQYVL